MTQPEPQEKEKELTEAEQTLEGFQQGRDNALSFQKNRTKTKEKPDSE